VRLAKAHAYIVSHLKKEMPSMFGKEKAQTKLLANLEDHFLKVHRTHTLPVGDFPDVGKFREVMSAHDLTKFPKLDIKMIHAMEAVLAHEIPKLMAQFPQEGTVSSGSGAAVHTALHHVAEHIASVPPPTLPPAAQIGYAAAPPPAAPPPTTNGGYTGNPYDLPGGRGAWSIPPADKARYDEVFATLSPTGGLASGMTVRPILERSGLPVDVLRQVWNLSDIDRDGQLDADEFAVAMHLTRECNAGRALPPTLPLDVCPPAKRHLMPA